MKKFLWVLMLVLTICLLTGCQANSTIEVAKLSEDESLLAKMIANQTAVFDLNIPKEARSVHINLYRMSDGKWEKLSGGGTPVSQRKERIVLAIDPDDGGVKLAHGGQQISFTQDTLDVGEVRSVTAAKLSETVKLDWEAETPVYLYIETGADMVSGSLSEFHHPENLAKHERVYALTVMISQKDAQ